VDRAAPDLFARHFSAMKERAKRCGAKKIELQTLILDAAFPTRLSPHPCSPDPKPEKRCGNSIIKLH